MHLFTIQMAAQLSGLSTHTIRAWEKRYNALTPNRSDTGRRLYTTEEIDRLSLLAQLTHIGNSIGQIANLPDQELKSMFNKLTNAGEKRTIQKKIDVNNFTDPKSTYQNLLMAIKNYKLDIISYELNKAKLNLPPKRFALEIAAPLLTEVGVMVARGQMSISQEHAFSSLLKFHIGHLLFKGYENKNKSQTKIAFATPEGDLHEFGILLSALICCQYEHEFYYLGPNLPAKALAEAVAATEADIVILGTMKGATEKEGLTNYLLSLARDLKPNVSLWIGGEAQFDTKAVKNMRNYQMIKSLSDLDTMLENL